MATLIHSLIFLVSCFLFYISGELIVESLIKIAKFLGWKEFALSFIIMSIVASFPNLFVGIFSAINNIPELSFGDVIGGNVIDLTLSVALAALFSQKRHNQLKAKPCIPLFFLLLLLLLCPCF